MIPNFKDKPFNDLTNDAKRALVERVCMEHAEYLAQVNRNGKNHDYLRYWRENAVNIKAPSNSAQMENYIYSEKEGLCIFDKNGATIPLKFMTEEIVIFIYNVVNPVPVKSEIVEFIFDGKPADFIIDWGIKARGEMLAPSKALARRRTGRPRNPDSKYQKVKRGELTRYEAYQKDSTNPSSRDEDDAL